MISNNNDANLLKNEKELIESNIKIQKNTKKMLINYMQIFADSINDFDDISTNSILDLIKNIKFCLELNNKNISLLEGFEKSIEVFLSSINDTNFEQNAMFDSFIKEYSDSNKTICENTLKIQECLCSISENVVRSPVVKNINAIKLDEKPIEKIQESIQENTQEFVQENIQESVQEFANGTNKEIFKEIPFEENIKNNAEEVSNEDSIAEDSIYDNYDNNEVNNETNNENLINNNNINNNDNNYDINQEEFLAEYRKHFIDTEKQPEQSETPMEEKLEEGFNPENNIVETDFDNDYNNNSINIDNNYADNNSNLIEEIYKNNNGDFQMSNDEDNPLPEDNDFSIPKVKHPKFLQEIEFNIPRKIEHIENTLVVSESTKSVTLPYSFSELNKKLNDKSNNYSSIDEIILDSYTLPIDMFKNPFNARFKQGYKLIRDKENGSMFDALELGLELMFNYKLHPAIIPACKNLNELDIYLDYLSEGKTNDFKCFNVKFDLPPAVIK